MPERESQAGAREDLVREDDRADADRQLRHLPSPGRHRSVADDQLRHDQGLRADDSRSGAHASACRRGTPIRTTTRSRTTARLSKDEIKTLVHWIEAGAPRGTGGDPLADLKKTWPEWALGEPDLSSRSRRSTCRRPASIPYQMPSVKNPLDRDVWVRAVDFLPGDRTVLHHIIATDGHGRRRRARRRQPRRLCARRGPDGAAEETGVLMQEGREVLLPDALHGDRQAGARREPHGPVLPQGRRRSISCAAPCCANPRLKIPANTKAHTESASRTFDRDVIVYSLLPHSHFRGKASNFVATYPDGTRGNAAVGAEVRLQLADDVRADRRRSCCRRAPRSRTARRGTTRRRTRRTPIRIATCRGASRRGTRCSTASCAIATSTRPRRRPRPSRARASSSRSRVWSDRRRTNRPALFFAHRESTDFAIVCADEQPLRDHVPSDLIEQLRTSRSRFEARHRIEREHLEHVAMHAMPHRRIGRQPRRRKSIVRRATLILQRAFR